MSPQAPAEEAWVANPVRPTPSNVSGRWFLANVAVTWRGRWSRIVREGHRTPDDAELKAALETMLPVFRGWAAAAEDLLDRWPGHPVEEEPGK